MSQLHVINHPMVQHKLTIMRDKETGSKDFRELLKEIATLMGYEVTRDIALEDVCIETPICKMTAKKVSGRKLAIVPILRAGLGLVACLRWFRWQGWAISAFTATRKPTSLWCITASFRKTSRTAWSSLRTPCWPPAAAPVTLS